MELLLFTIYVCILSVLKDKIRIFSEIHIFAVKFSNGHCSHIFGTNAEHFVKGPSTPDSGIKASLGRRLGKEGRWEVNSWDTGLFACWSTEIPSNQCSQFTLSILLSKILRRVAMWSNSWIQLSDILHYSNNSRTTEYCGMRVNGDYILSLFNNTSNNTNTNDNPNTDGTTLTQSVALLKPGHVNGTSRSGLTELCVLQTWRFQ